MSLALFTFCSATEKFTYPELVLIASPKHFDFLFLLITVRVLIASPKHFDFYFFYLQ